MPEQQDYFLNTLTYSGVILQAGHYMEGQEQYHWRSSYFQLAYASLKLPHLISDLVTGHLFIYFLCDSELYLKNTT